jgi:hypothetical protein
MLPPDRGSSDAEALDLPQAAAAARGGRPVRRHFRGVEIFRPSAPGFALTRSTARFGWPGWDRATIRGVTFATAAIAARLTAPAELGRIAVPARHPQAMTRL